MAEAALRGLTSEEERLTVEAYFDRFDWDPVMLDPSRAAGDFLDSL